IRIGIVRIRVIGIRVIGIRIIGIRISRIWRYHHRSRREAPAKEEVLMAKILMREKRLMRKEAVLREKARMPEEAALRGEPWMTEELTSRGKSRMSGKPGVPSELLRRHRAAQQGCCDARDAEHSNHRRRRHARALSL